MTRYCVYCGHEINQNTKICPFCREDVSEESENKKYQASVLCTKCNSNNVTFQIKRKKVGNIVHEEEMYECNDCGKTFSDENRVGKSFSNAAHVAYSKKTEKLITWGFILFIVIGIIVNKNIEKTNEDNNRPMLDCSGLETVSIKKMQEEAEEYGKLEETRKKYVGNSYIFTIHVHEINDRVITNTEGDDGKHAFSHITVNKAEKEKLSKYKPGDTIKVCGTVKDITWYLYSVKIENASIIE